MTVESGMKDAIVMENTNGDEIVVGVAAIYVDEDGSLAIDIEVKGKWSDANGSFSTNGRQVRTLRFNPIQARSVPMPDIRRQGAI